jgi:hypothetical protein
LFAAFRRGRGLSRITGPVLRPADPGYAAELAAFNTAFTLRPGLVVGAANEADVVAAVGRAAADGLPVATKGAGHGVVADVTAPVLISTRRLDSVVIDRKRGTARVGAGATWAQVVAAAAPHGLAPLCGSSTQVGVAGYTLGGGLGLLGRAYGFAADRVRRLRLVTADGRPHEIDAHRAPELFWALRGAGKSGFGVVTELEFDLVPVSRLYGGGIYFPAAAAADLLHAWLEWAPTLPEPASTSIAVLRLPPDPELPPPLRGRTVLHLRYSHCDPGSGTTAARAEALLAPMRRVAEPLVDGIGELPYTAVDTIHGDPTTPMPVLESGTALRELPAEAVDALLAVAGPEQDIPLVMAELRSLGGALARPAPVPNVVAGRSAVCSLFVLGPMAEEVAAVVPGVVAGVVDALAPWSLGGALPNFAGAERPGALWSPRDRARLRLLQRAVDPDGMFATSPIA